MKYILLIIICLTLAGCWLFPEPTPEPIPVISISIVPESSEIKLGESIELFCIDQEGRAVMARWSKRCGAGGLSVDIGESCVYTTPRNMTGIQMIYAEYED